MQDANDNQHSIFWDSYVGLVYGVLYLCFVAYPIAFQTERGWTPGIGGLSFVGIGIGVLIAIACEPLFRKVINRQRKDPSTGEVPPEAMASIVVLGTILLAAGQLWFTWTCTPDLHWIVPILAGLPFGAGKVCVFIYATNYLARSFGQYTASALSGNMLVRSLMAACLPLAGPSMYGTLGLNWASILLGLVEAVGISTPVVFYFQGHRIRKASRMIQEIEKSKEGM